MYPSHMYIYLQSLFHNAINAWSPLTIPYERAGKANNRKSGTIKRTLFRLPKSQCVWEYSSPHWLTPIKGYLKHTHTHNNLSFAFSFACLDFIFVFFSATSSSSSPSSSLLASVQQYHEISV